MNDLDNILLFEHSPEAIEALNSGNAIVGPGGIRTKNGGKFIELAKPITMSVADFKSMFEGKDHALETERKLDELDCRLAFSEKSLHEIEKVSWLNYELNQHIYTVTYEGFQQTLMGLESIINQISNLEEYVRKRDKSDLIEKTMVFVNYMKSDAGLMQSKKYSVTNGNIAEHLDNISAFLMRLINEIDHVKDEQLLKAKLIQKIIKPFAYVIRRYTALYYYENEGEIMPGNYDEWNNVLSIVRKSKKISDILEYYIKLNLDIPLRDKILLNGIINRGVRLCALNVEEEYKYIQNHTKEQYLTRNDHLIKQFENGDYYSICQYLVFVN